MLHITGPRQLGVARGGARGAAAAVRAHVGANAPIQALRVAASGPARRSSTYRMVSVDEVQAKQAAWEARVAVAKKAVMALGYPELAVFRQDTVWSDHDRFQHGASRPGKCADTVNNICYVRWLESTRISWLENVCSTLDRQLYEDINLGRNIGIILASNYVRYRRPVTDPDTVMIGHAPLPLERSDRFTIRSVIYSTKEEAVAAQADQVVCMYDYNRNSKTEIPEQLKKAFAAWELRQ